MLIANSLLNQGLAESSGGWRLWQDPLASLAEAHLWTKMFVFFFFLHHTPAVAWDLPIHHFDGEGHQSSITIYNKQLKQFDHNSIKYLKQSYRLCIYRVWRENIDRDDFTQLDNHNMSEHFSCKHQPHREEIPQHAFNPTQVWSCFGGNRPSGIECDGTLMTLSVRSRKRRVSWRMLLLRTLVLWMLADEEHLLLSIIFCDMEHEIMAKGKELLQSYKWLLSIDYYLWIISIIA